MNKKNDIPFELQKKYGLSTSVPPLVMLLIGTEDIPGLIKYVDRPTIVAGAILKEIKNEFPDRFQEGVDMIKKYIEDHPNDKRALKTWKRTEKILEGI